MDAGAAELLLARALACGALHHRRAGDHHVRRVARHHGEVGCDQARRGKARDRAHRRRDHRGRRHRAGDGEEAVRGVDRVAARARTPPARSDYAPAAALEEADQRQPVADGELLGEDALAQAGGGGRAAAQGEVLAAQHAGPPVDLREAEHVVGRREGGQLAALVELGVTGEGALLAEAPGVRQGLDALADREPAQLVLARHGLRAAELLRPAAALLDALDLRLPAHSSQHITGFCAARRGTLSKVRFPEAGKLNL